VSDSADRDEASPPTDDAEHRLLTVPNILSIGRIVGSAGLIWLAWIGAENWFIGVFLFFILTDWLDGKLAVLLDQRSVLGARLDSIGDTVLYSCLVIGALFLAPDFMRDQWGLIVAMIASHLLAGGAAVLKFRRIPAYHTRAAKTCWFLVCVGAVVLFIGGPWWPAQLALAAVILTNLQSIAITRTLPHWEADVSSWWHARRIARSAEGG